MAVRSLRPHDAPPIASINITPLIDVMLVLLIMLILTLPTMTHQVPVDLPQPCTRCVIDPQQQHHQLQIAASGALLLDGQAVSEGALADRLAAIAAAGQDLALDTDAEARYDVFDRVLAVVKRAGITKLGFVDNARFVAMTR